MHVLNVLNMVSVVKDYLVLWMNECMNEKWITKQRNLCVHEVFYACFAFYLNTVGEEHTGFEWKQFKEHESECMTVFQLTLY